MRLFYALLLPVFFLLDSSLLFAQCPTTLDIRRVGTGTNGTNTHPFTYPTGGGIPDALSTSSANTLCQGSQLYLLEVSPAAVIAWPAGTNIDFADAYNGATQVTSTGTATSAVVTHLYFGINSATASNFTITFDGACPVELSFLPEPIVSNLATDITLSNKDNVGTGPTSGQEYCNGTVPSFNAVCTGATSVGGPCHSLSYDWTLDGSGGFTDNFTGNPGTPTGTLTLADATAVAPTSGSYAVALVMTNGNADLTGEFCRATFNTSAIVRPDPALNAIQVNGNASAAVCVYTEPVISVAHTNAEASNHSYTWSYNDRAGSGWVEINGLTPLTNLIAGTSITGSPTPASPGTATANITLRLEGTTSPNTYVPGTTTNNLPLRSGMDLEVVAVNNYGCSARERSNTGILTVNDRPGVMVYLNDPAQTNNFGTRTTFSTCTGEAIKLRHVACSRATYEPVNMSNYNYSNNAEPNTANGGINYQTPCDGTGANSIFFDQVTWTGTYLSGGNVLTSDLDAGNTGTNTITSFTPGTGDDDRAMETNTSLGPSATGGTDVITYRVTVVGHNGCENYDEIDVNVNDGAVSVEYGNTVVNNETGGGASYAEACAGAAVTLEANCSGCSGQTWTRVGGSGTTVNIDVGDSGSNDMTTDPLAGSVGDYNVYQFSATQGGCTVTQEVRVVVGDGPAFNLTDVSTCTNAPFVFTNSDPNSGSYTQVRIYKSDPNSPGSSVFRTINSNFGTIEVAGGGRPSGNQTYWFEVDYPNCPDTYTYNFDAYDPPTFRTLTPFGLNTPNTDSKCNIEDLKFIANATYTNPSNTYDTLNLNYTWAATGIGGTSTTPLPVPPHPESDLGNETTASGGFSIRIIFIGWFPIFVIVPNSPSENSFTFNSGLPNQSNTTLGVTVTDPTTTCTITEDWEFDILNCGIPFLEKTKFPLNTSTPIDTFDTYACLNQNVALTINTPNRNFPIEYEWRQEATDTVIVGTDSTFIYQSTNSQPDTVFTTCTVYRISGSDREVISVFFDTTIISRGFLDVYPRGDNDINNIDTALCLNEVLEPSVACATCLNNAIYIWNTSPIDTMQPVSVGDRLAALYPATIPGDTVDVTLRVEHGENCISEAFREAKVNNAPQVSLIHNGVPVGTGTANPVIYLCDGVPEDIEVDLTSCMTCGTTSFTWNTASTTPTISVSSQGGYYAEVRDQNACLGVTTTVIALDALDGLNAAVTAVPSQICAGNDAELQVAACPGCSYEWFDGANGSIANSRTHLVSAADNYYAQVTNPQGCVYTTNLVPVTVGTATIPTITATTDSICSGQSSTLSTTPIAGAMYQWYRNTASGLVVISGATDSSYTTTTAGTYLVNVNYPNGCLLESPLYTIEDASFKPSITPATSAVVCVGSTADLFTDQFPNWTYQWYNNGIPIANANGSIFSATTTGSHYVEVTNSNGCIARSDSVDVTTSTLPTPNATTNTPTYCPGETGELSVSLCSGCLYKWFNANTGQAVTTDSAVANYRISSDTFSGDYYAVVYQDICSATSDTISVTQISLLTPPIIASSPVICNGIDVTLTTTSCLNCNYTWLKNGIPVIGGVNDTVHIINNIADIGVYQVSVLYPNGCREISVHHPITDGSFTATLLLDSAGVTPFYPDSVICNGAAQDLRVIHPGSNLPGTYFYTLFLTPTPVTGFSNVTSPSFVGANAGSYVVQVTDPRGCISVSNEIPLREVNVQPILDARATPDVSSVTARAICTDSGSVYMWVSNCVGCAIQWESGGNPISMANNQPIGPADFNITTDLGGPGAGVYTVTGTLDGCSATSNQVTIIDLVGPTNYAGSEPNTLDTSICDGQSIDLGYMPSGTASSALYSFRWLREDVVNNRIVPVNGASTNQYTASAAGTYFLEVTTDFGCVDTSAAINVLEVTPPTGFQLNLDSLVVAGTGTPLASLGLPIDLNNWVFPGAVRTDSLMSPDSAYFTSVPFSGSLFQNAGLFGPDSSFFNPDDTLSGFHLITFHYSTQGCQFTVSDVLEVLPPASIVVTNSNPSSVAYEACVGDDLTITTTNLGFPIHEVYAFDTDDNYFKLGLNSRIINDTVFGANTVYSTTINLSVPGNAYASYLMLVDSVNNDTTYTSFVLIHNTDLSFTGLPSMLCSNGAPLTLFGTPTGGSYYVTDTLGAVIPGITVADTLYPTAFSQTGYQNGSRWVDVYYSFRESFTNGNACPTDDTVSIRRELRDMSLTGVTFNTIAVSQSRERLTNLVYQTTPYDARPNKSNYNIRFSGSFTSPAGNPTEFLPANAGIGKHALRYYIESGICVNSVEDSIEVLPAPTPLGIPSNICRNDGPYTFVRDVDFPYAAPGPFFVSGVASFNDIRHEMRVTSVNTNQAIIVNNASPGNESFTYDPSLLVGNQDTLLVEYWFVRAEDTLGVNFDSLSYVIGEIYLPIYVEDPIAVEIVDTIVQPFYCQEDKIHLLAGNPTSNAFGGGLFMLYGGTGQYQNGDTLNSNVINPYDVNHLENAVTTYDLVYILNGLVCQNSDTMQVTISKGLNPSFVTASGATEFCDSDPNEPIITNVAVPDTAIWKIGGIPQSSYNFTPIPLDPGIHLVELEVIDTFGCSVSVTDTFTIHALPTVSVSPGFNAQYCANDPTVDFIVSPSPYCTNYSGAGHILVQEDFNSGVPPTWRTFVNAGKPWAPTGALPQGGTGGAIIADSSNTAASDSWILTDSIQFELGHTYRITYMVRVGDFATSCNSFCDASLNVAMGQVRDPNFITYQLDYQPILSNNQAYVRFVVDHVHTGSGLTTGKYFIGFQNFTPLGGRPIRLDNFMVRDMTIANCSQTGIGYANGSGVHQVVDSLYQFNPLAATAGNFDITYVYTDFRGCQDSVAFNIQLDTAPIVSFTDMRPSYCDNEDTILLTGSPLGGAFTSTIAGNLTDVPFFAPLNPANFPVNYAMTNRGVDTVAYTYTDGNGCSETAYDTVEIVPVLDINVINENILDPGAPGHCTYDPGQIIDVFPQTGALIDSGVVYGPGVRNGLDGPGTAMFYPDSAVLDMGHTGDATLMYIYTSTTGCLDTTFTVTRVHASPNVSFINLPDSICLNADTVALAIKNSVTTGSMGQITYSLTLPIQSGQYRSTDNNGNVVPNFISIFDDLQPAAATGYNEVNVRYIYEADPTLGSCRDTIYKTVRIDTVPLIRFLDIPPYFCENDSPRVISAQPSYYNGSGYLLIDTVQYNASYTTVIPSLMVGAGPSTATYPVYYTFRDTRGCVGEGFDTFEVRPYPRIVFSPNFQDTFCRSVGRYDLRQGVISPVGGYFTDNLALTSIVDSFYLDLNAVAGPRLLTYHYLDTSTNCYNSDTIRVYVFNGPDLDFATVGGCALSTVDFQSTALNLQSGIDSITNIWWDFEGTGNFVPVNLGTPITIPDTSYQYTASGVYNVTLRVENQGACTQSITKPVIISPYYDLAAADYFEDFNAGAGGWYADQTITTIPASGVWEHVNSAAGTHISHSDGLWVTVPDTIYTADQDAWVYSPCFDFTNSRRPMIAFNVWRDVLRNIDGAVLEWYDRNNNSWELVGNVGEGINWYQSNFILSTPGNQSQVTFPKGWTGRSGGFESARLRLDQFKGQRDIRFRVAFATSPQTVLDTLQNDYEGIAFDDVWIGERTRNVLVEHFNNFNYTNAAGDNSDVIDRSVYNKIFNSNYGLDVVLGQYQTEYSANGVTAPDLVHDANTSDLNSRSLYYSIFESNRIMVDGRTIGTGLSQDLNTYNLDYDMLQFPDFDVRIQTPTYIGNTINIQSTVEALNALPTDNYTIHTVVIQDSFTINPRGFNMLSVVRKMLPNASGNVMTNRLWNVGDSVVTAVNWDYDFMLNPVPVASFNGTQLEVLVFVQNLRTQEVYQVATTQDLNRYTGTGNIQDDPAAELLNVKVYPNPSSDLFNVAFDEVLDQNYQWQLVDVAGRVLQAGMAEAGIDRFTISADRLTDGAYFFVIRGKNISAHRKLIVIKN